MEEKINEILKEKHLEFLNSDLGITRRTPEAFDFSEEANLYHYTSLEALESILVNESFWLSNSKFLNDSSEVLYTQKLIKDTYEELFSEDIKFIEKMEIILDLINDKLSDLYILSLSLNGDSLALWSNYNKHEGYNLALDFWWFDNHSIFVRDKDELLHHVGNHQLITMIPGIVVYDLDLQKFLVQSRIKLLFEIHKEFPSYDFNQKDGIIESIVANLALHSIFFKNPSFIQEEEYRISILIDDKELKEKVIRHRKSNGIFIPYIELVLNETNNPRLLPLSELCIGPKNNLDIAEEGLFSFVKNAGYNFFRIKRSGIPLRY